MPRSRRSRQRKLANKVNRQRSRSSRSFPINLESETTSHLIHAFLKRDMHQAQRHLLDMVGEMMDSRK